MFLKEARQIGSDEVGGKRRLLVCDDDYGPRRSLEIVFQKDFEILTAEDGPKALELARNQPVDVAVLDLKMAEMSGIEVLQELKRIDPTTSVIILTGFETIETAQQAVRLNATDYLNKPFEVDTIRQAVNKAVEQRIVSSQARANVLKLQELQDELENQRVHGEMQRTRGEIYASIIHDINSPLTVIAGIVQLMLQRFEPLTTLDADNLSHLKDRLNQVTRQINKCIEISRRYLSLFRDRSTVTSRVELNQVFADLGELLKFFPSISAHRLKIEHLNKDCVVPFNGTDLIQLLLNLATNALQSTKEPHAVTISAAEVDSPPAADFESSHERWLHYETIADQRRLLRLSVADDGPGIAPENLDSIFETSFTTKEQNEGSGLGLSIVKRLTKQNGAALHVVSCLGSGAQFSLWIPLTEETNPPSKSA